MASDEPKPDAERAFRWRREDTYQTVTAAAFAKKVFEDGARVEGPFGGYYYAMVESTEGQELWRAPGPSWDDATVQEATSANPAAGAEPTTLTVPAGKRWKLMFWSFDLVTDANVANRTIACEVRIAGVNNVSIVYTTTAHTASLTRYYRYDAMKTFGESYVSGVYVVGLGRSDGLELPAGATVVFTIINKQAGDDASATRYTYKELDA